MNKNNTNAIKIIRSSAITLMIFIIIFIGIFAGLGLTTPYANKK
jgi:hypothetical protein